MWWKCTLQKKTKNNHLHCTLHLIPSARWKCPCKVNSLSVFCKGTQWYFNRSVGWTLSYASKAPTLSESSVKQKKKRQICFYGIFNSFIRNGPLFFPFQVTEFIHNGSGLTAGRKYLILWFHTKIGLDKNTIEDYTTFGFNSAFMAATECFSDKCTWQDIFMFCLYVCICIGMYIVNV